MQGKLQAILVLARTRIALANRGVRWCEDEIVPKSLVYASEKLKSFVFFLDPQRYS